MNVHTVNKCYGLVGPPKDFKFTITSLASEHVSGETSQSISFMTIDQYVQ